LMLDGRVAPREVADLAQAQCGSEDLAQAVFARVFVVAGSSSSAGAAVEAMPATAVPARRP